MTAAITAAVRQWRVRRVMVVPFSMVMSG
jgi:hypothetical protein